MRVLRRFALCAVVPVMLAGAVVPAASAHDMAPPLPDCLTAPMTGPDLPPLPEPDSRLAKPLRFGIAPDSFNWADNPEAPPDDPTAINRALDELQGRQSRFTVRWYEIYDPETSYDNQIPVEPLLRKGRRLDLVLMYFSTQGDVAGYLDYVRESVRRYATVLDTIQITNEPDMTFDENPFPGLIDALTQGAIAAKQEAHRIGRPRIKAGFSVAIGQSESDRSFWTALADAATPEFTRSIDYVSLDTYPGPFDPVPPRPDGQPGDLRHMAVHELRTVRECALPYVGLHRAEMQISENGWPSGPPTLHSEAEQADRLSIVINAINDYRGNYGVTRYEFFHLLDGVTDEPDTYGLNSLGLLRSDYTPKPAFATYRDLVRQLGT